MPGQLGRWAWALGVLVVLTLLVGLGFSWASYRAATLADEARRQTGLGALNAASVSLAAALRWQPHDPDLWRQSSVLLGTRALLHPAPELGQLSILSARRATTLRPNDARTLFALGWALLAAGQTEAAQTAFQTALRLDPHNESVLYALGLAYELSGGTREAARMYRAAWKVLPDPVLYDALQRLGETP